MKVSCILSSTQYGSIVTYFTFGVYLVPYSLKECVEYVLCSESMYFT